jgi:hypothetical protein
MIELLIKRREELRRKYRRDMDIEVAYRHKEVELLIKRYRKQIEAEVDAAGFREELTQLAKDMSTLEAL